MVVRHRPLIQALRKQSQEDLCEFEASLVYKKEFQGNSGYTEKLSLKRKTKKSNRKLKNSHMAVLSSWHTIHRHICEQNIHNTHKKKLKRYEKETLLYQIKSNPPVSISKSVCVYIYPGHVKARG